MAQIEPRPSSRQSRRSPLQAKYGTAIDRESAYEKLNAKLAAAPTPPPAPQPPGAQTPTDGKPAARPPKPAKPKPSAVEQVLKSSAFKSFARSTATVLGREITRGIFGTRRR